MALYTGSDREGLYKRAASANMVMTRPRNHQNNEDVFKDVLSFDPLADTVCAHRQSGAIWDTPSHPRQRWGDDKKEGGLRWTAEQGSAGGAGLAKKEAGREKRKQLQEGNQKRRKH
jgi:hypothetical protein